MPRIRITLPQKMIFSTEIPVRVSDLNYGGHVGHDHLLSLMQEARVLFYRTLGSRDEISLEGDVGQIITDAAVQYNSESFLGDVLIVDISVDEFQKYGFQMFYLVTNKHSGKEVARGQTGIVCFDYAKKKIASMPTNFLEKLRAL